MYIRVTGCKYIFFLDISKQKLNFNTFAPQIFNNNKMYFSEEEKIICNCLSVSEHEILDAIKNKGARTVADVQDITGAGTSCGSCIPEIEEILDKELGK